MVKKQLYLFCDWLLLIIPSINYCRQCQCYILDCDFQIGTYKYAFIFNETSVWHAFQCVEVVLCYRYKFPSILAWTHHFELAWTHHFEIRLSVTVPFVFRDTFLKFFMSLWALIVINSIRKSLSNLYILIKFPDIFIQLLISGIFFCK